MPSFSFEDHRISYREVGSGPRTLVLIHGLLMNSRMYTRLAPEMASRGNRVISVNLLGHGDSDRPVDPRLYSMTQFGDQVAALLDHLEVEEAVVGGTSLGANVSLEFAVRHPARARGLFVEMPVLENAAVAVAAIFTPLLLTMRFGMPGLKALAMGANAVPRSHYLADIFLDWVRQDPEASFAVLKGLLQGRTCPPRFEREAIETAALIVGHPADPLHPFSDSDMLARELPRSELVDANSIIEWRLSPRRLNDRLAEFLDAAWAPRAAASTAA